MIQDLLSRSLASLRISVTDRCNLRCGYCMPEEDYVWLERSKLLCFEELVRLARIFHGLGMRKLRLTGGEPLLRRDLPRLVQGLAHIDGLDLALTTNATLLSELAAPLHAAGLGRLTISLDSLHPERFLRLTRRDEHDRVLQGIAAARAAGFTALKLNCVVQRGLNDDELCELLEFARAGEYEMRFIEYMDVGGATGWDPKWVVSRSEILQLIAAVYGTPRAIPTHDNAPAERFALPDGLVFGVLAPTTAPFCRTCDRARLTADGKLFLCLYGRHGLNLASPLRAGASDEDLAQLIRGAWQARSDRGAEERLGLAQRNVLATVSELRRDPHLEMHTRGG